MGTRECAHASYLLRSDAASQFALLPASSVDAAAAAAAGVLLRLHEGFLAGHADFAASAAALMRAGLAG